MDTYITQAEVVKCLWLDTAAGELVYRSLPRPFAVIPLNGSRTTMVLCLRPRVEISEKTRLNVLPTW